jgi:hypothetical protein
MAPASRPVLVRSVLTVAAVGAVVALVATSSSRGTTVAAAPETTVEAPSTPTTAPTTTTVAPLGPPLYERVSRRTTDFDIAVRVFTQEQQFFDGGALPPECFGPPLSVIVELSSEQMIGSGWAQPVLADDAIAVIGSGVVGVYEGDPVAWTVVETSDDVVEVTVDFESGTVDATWPIGGYAVLATPIVGDASTLFGPPLGTVTARLDDGSTVTARTEEIRTWSPSDPDACTPPPPSPPSLPEPSGEPPADVDAATAAVQTAFATVFDGDANDVDAKLAFIDRPRALADTFAQAAINFPDATASARTRIDEVRFLDGETAAVLWSLDVQGYNGFFQNQIGYAYLTDGVWKVSRGTVCGVLGLAASCPLG